MKDIEVNRKSNIRTAFKKNKKKQNRLSDSRTIMKLGRTQTERIPDGAKDRLVLNKGEMQSKRNSQLRYRIMQLRYGKE